jgi:phosphatidylglycerophosphatase A
MSERLVKFFATGFGSGCLPKAPGTWGTVVGIAYAWALSLLDWRWQLGIIVSVLLLAVWLSGVAERLFQRKDAQEIVIDEIAAFPLAAFFAWGGERWTPLLVGAAFVLFRIADILKPFPARQSQQLRGGWGVVADDVVAAVYAGTVILGIRVALEKM